MSYDSSYAQPSVSFFARNRPDGRIGFWWLSDDSGTWQDAKDDLRRTFTHATGLRYDPDHREWTAPHYSLDRLQRWANAWAYNQQEWNAAPRNGRQSYHEPHQDAQDAPEPALTTAYKALCLTPDAPPDLVQTAYRWWAKQTHPDHNGGDGQAMTAVNQAVAVIRAHGRAS